MAEDRPFVARDEDIHALTERWEAAKAGTPTVLRLQGPYGGGRRAAVGELLQRIQASDEDVVLWRVACVDQENGVQWLVRMYGSLVAALTSDVLRRGRIELMLNAQLPHQPRRVQQWYQEFIAALKDAKTDSEKNSVQLRLPRDNPLVGLIEVASAIARKMPVILELQNPYTVYSVALAQFVEAIAGEAREHGGQLMVILHDEADDNVAKACHPAPLVDMWSRMEHDVHAIAPWGEGEVASYLSTRGKSGNAARIAEIASGRPGFVAETIEILEALGELDSALEGVTLASLTPLTVDEDELEEPEGEPEEGKPKPAGAADIERAAFFAALLGQAFPSGFVADIGGWTRDSVDDLVDAAGDLFEEVQFSEQLGTWIYKFTRGSWREGVLELNDTDEGHELARRVGLFMERAFVPRGYLFIPKTARIYAEHGAYDRANMLRGVALANDSRDVWGLSFDLMEYFDEVKWPAPMRRLVLMNLVDHLVTTGALQAAEQIHGKATTWATEAEDRDLTAWLLLAGSRLDARRQDLYRARDRARDALTLFTALENKSRAAEVHIHLAQIELQDGNPNAALDAVNEAVQLARIKVADDKDALPPAIAANAELIRGTVARRSGKVAESVDNFRRANTIAGQAGIAGVAISAGLALGEALLASRQVDKSVEVLRQMVQITTSSRNAVQERTAHELLAQASGALRNMDEAVQHAARALQISQQLKFDNLIPLDLFNLARFQMLNNKPTEALALFKQVAPAIPGMGKHPMVREFHYFYGVALIQTGNLDGGRTSLRAALPLVQAASDWPKMVSTLEHLATVEERSGNTDVAKKLLTDAMAFAKKGELRDARKALKKRLEAMG